MGEGFEGSTVGVGEVDPGVAAPAPPVGVGEVEPLSHFQQYELVSPVITLHHKSFLVASGSLST